MSENEVITNDVKLKPKKKFYKKWWFWGIITTVVLLIVILSNSSPYPSDLIDLPKDAYIQQSQVFDYDSINRNPSEYNKKLAVFTGEVIQVLRDGDDLQMRVNVTLVGEDGLFPQYTDTVYVFYKISDGVNVLEGDIITMYGELRELQEYTSTLGVKISIPRMFVKYIIIEE